MEKQQPPFEIYETVRHLAGGPRLLLMGYVADELANASEEYAKARVAWFNKFDELQYATFYVEELFRET